jgi:hypothetical protein
MAMLISELTNFTGPDAALIALGRKSFIAYLEIDVERLRKVIELYETFAEVGVLDDEDRRTLNRLKLISCAFGPEEEVEQPVITVPPTLTDRPHKLAA